MRQRDRFAGTRPAKHVAAVSTMVLSISKGERCTATHTNFRVGPFGWLFYKPSQPIPSLHMLMLP